VPKGKITTSDESVTSLTTLLVKREKMGKDPDVARGKIEAENDRSAENVV